MTITIAPDPSDTHPLMQYFDPHQEVAILERRLPHWMQSGTVAFVTWRTWDSIPKDVLRSWLAERDAWLGAHGIDPALGEWRAALDRLPPAVTVDFRRQVAERWDRHLDDCHGDCMLRRPELAQVVAGSLQRFAGDRYELSDFVVMPNHVHVLAAFPDEPSMLQQCESWKHFTATKINRTLGRKGRFWQQDGFDHLVRTPDEMDRLRRYIAGNPCRAKLPRGDYVHFSRPR